MDRVAVVTGADRGLGYELCKGLLVEGWHVFAGQYMPDWPQLAELAKEFAGKLFVVSMDMASTGSVKSAVQAVANEADHVDLLISNAGIVADEGEFGAGLDYDKMGRIYEVNALGSIRLVEAFLPLTIGGLKRLCFVSSEAGSVAMAHRDEMFGYCMSKTALNMAVKIMFNHLRPEGYTFRLYHPGWLRSFMHGDKSTVGDMEPEESAAAAISFFTGDREDEDRLVLIDNLGREWPF